MLHCGGELQPSLMQLHIHSQLPRAIRRLGYRAHALLDYEPSPNGLQFLLHQFDRVFVWRRGASLAAVSARLRQQRYSAVLCWEGKNLVLADALGAQLGAGSRYLGRHAISEDDKLQTRSLLAQRRGASSTPFRAIRSLTDLFAGLGALVWERLAHDSARSSAHPCFPCFLKVVSSIGGSAGRLEQPHLFSGRIDTWAQLYNAAHRMLRPTSPEATPPLLILERFLQGPEVRIWIVNA